MLASARGDQPGDFRIAGTRCGYGGAAFRGTACTRRVIDALGDIAGQYRLRVGRRSEYDQNEDECRAETHQRGCH
jgi:hypothetical protein